MEEPVTKIEVIILDDGINAKDIRGNVYKIDTITLGMGYHRKPIKYTKHFLKKGAKCRAEILKNGKLNII